MEQKFSYKSYINIHLEKKIVDLKTGFLRIFFSEHLLKSNELHVYDKDIRIREFKPGETVLVLLPVPGHPSQAKYCWPYM